MTKNSHSQDPLQPGEATTAEEAMDDATVEEGFSDESAYTASEETPKVVGHEPDQAT
jgi:hypothetical protein